MDFMTWLRTNWDRVLGCALIVVGAVLLIVGTVQVSHARLLADSLSYLMSAGLGGLGCVALGAALLISAGLHDEWQKIDVIEQALREGMEHLGAAPLAEWPDALAKSSQSSVAKVESPYSSVDLTSTLDLEDTWSEEAVGRGGRRQGA